MTNKASASVLITSAGRRAELIQIWKNSIAEMLGSDSKVYANDLNPSLSAACQIADHSFQICRCTDPTYASQVLAQCLDHGIRLVIPTIDTELQALSEARQAFESAGVQLVVSDPELIRQCRNKRLTSGLFDSLFIETPDILDPSALTFPCFMKPIGGSCSQGIKIIETPEQLASSDISNPGNLFQELIPKAWIEYSADLYYSKLGNLLACVPRQRLETRGGERSKGITRKDNVYQFIKDQLAILDGARGVVTLQLFTDPNREKFLGVEINPRFGGGYPMSHAAGAEYPAMLIKEYLLCESLEYNESWEKDLLMLRHDTMVFSRQSNASSIP
jgi:carbamoyl-phosphate synthase large subunit